MLIVQKERAKTLFVVLSGLFIWLFYVFFLKPIIGADNSTISGTLKIVPGLFAFISIIFYKKSSYYRKYKNTVIPAIPKQIFGEYKYEEQKGLSKRFMNEIFETMFSYFQSEDLIEVKIDGLRCGISEVKSQMQLLNKTYLNYQGIAIVIIVPNRILDCGLLVPNTSNIKIVDKMVNVFRGTRTFRIEKSKSRIILDNKYTYYELQKNKATIVANQFIEYLKYLDENDVRPIVSISETYIVIFIDNKSTFFEPNLFSTSETIRHLHADIEKLKYLCRMVTYISNEIKYIQKKK